MLRYYWMDFRKIDWYCFLLILRIFYVTHCKYPITFKVVSKYFDLAFCTSKFLLLSICIKNNIVFGIEWTNAQLNLKLPSLRTTNYMCTQQFNYSKHSFQLHVQVNLPCLTRFTFSNMLSLLLLLHINHLS